MAQITGLPFNVNDTGSATVTVQAVSSTGKLIKLKKLGFSASPTTTDNITIYFGSRAIWGPIYCSGVTNGVWDFDDVKMQGQPDESLKAVKGAAGTLLTVYGVYEEL